MDEVISAWTRKHTKLDAMKLVGDAGIPAGAVLDTDELNNTTGEVTGRLPLVGWVTVLSWRREPEVARRQGEVWRLVGFQD